MSKQRIVLVTGGGSGIGKAIANKFADNGDLVYVLGRDLKKLENVAKGYDNINTQEIDITSPTSVKKARKAITSKHKTVDILVNCAGGNFKIGADPSLEEANEVWGKIVDLNLTGTFNVIFAFLPNMARPGGRIINIGSMAALGGSRQPGITGQAYSAAKAGLHGLARTLTSSLGRDEITINTIAPGVIDHTEFFGGTGVSEATKQAYDGKIPLGRLGNPEDIAAGTYYLASEEAAYVTGEILNINGGAQFGR